MSFSKKSYKISIAMLLALVLSLFVIKIYADSTRIYPNAQFEHNTYLVAGQTYAQGADNLTYKMVDINRSSNSLFDSSDRTRAYFHVTTVSNLPAGLSWTQTLDRNHPASNTFYIYGTVAADFAPGVYVVSVAGEDVLHPGAPNTTVQTINVNISSLAPQRTQNAAQIIGNVNAAPDPETKNIARYFTVPAGGSVIDSYRVNNPTALPSNFTLTANGDLQGTYLQSGTFSNVSVSAHNQAGWSHEDQKLQLSFFVSETDTPPYPEPSTKTIEGIVNGTIDIPMSQFFKKHIGASSITEYRLLDDAKLPSGIQWVMTSNEAYLRGTYTQSKTYEGIEIQARNAKDWSSSFTLTFHVVPVEIAPAPQSSPVVIPAAKVGDDITLTDLNANLKTYFRTNQNGADIDKFEVNTAKLPPGISFVNNRFTGTYTEAGSYHEVLLKAHNAVDWGAPVKLYFDISNPNLPPYLLPDNVGIEVPGVVEQAVDVAHMDHFFSVHPGSQSPTSYPLSGSLPRGAIYDDVNGVFSGSYSEPTDRIVHVKAHNDQGDSAELAIHFIISASRSVPTPKFSEDSVSPQKGNAIALNSLDQYFTAPSSASITAYELDTNTLPPGITYDRATNRFSGYFSKTGNFNTEIRARNVNGLSSPYVIHFRVIAPPTLMCPTVDKIRGCVSPVTINASSSTSYTYTNSRCTGIVWKFKMAQLNRVGQGSQLTCTYYSSNAVPSWVYSSSVLPERTYYGDDIQTRTADCSSSDINTCVFNVPE